MTEGPPQRPESPNNGHDTSWIDYAREIIEKIGDGIDYGPIGVRCSGIDWVQGTVNITATCTDCGAQETNPTAGAQQHMVFLAALVRAKNCRERGHEW